MMSLLTTWRNSCSQTPHFIRCQSTQARIYRLWVL